MLLLRDGSQVYINEQNIMDRSRTGLCLQGPFNKSTAFDLTNVRTTCIVIVRYLDQCSIYRSVDGLHEKFLSDLLRSGKYRASGSFHFGYQVMRL